LRQCAEEFDIDDLHEALQLNLQTYWTWTMDASAGIQGEVFDFGCYSVDGDGAGFQRFSPLSRPADHSPP
jgi:hypothetical protein